MGHLYGWNDILVRPDELRAFAWSAPMRELAVKVDLSDTGLKKLLGSHGIVAPPQGYWNKVHAGKPVPQCPRTPPRRPGEIGQVRLDARFAKVLSPAEPIPSAGPFASSAVPEDLMELRAQELKAIGRVAIPRSLERVHRGLAQILKQEKRRHEKSAGERWHWDTPKFESPLDKRRLRILNAVFMALGKRGHDGEAHELDGEIHAKAVIGDTHIGLELDVAGRGRAVHSRSGVRSTPNLPATTRLALRVDPDFDGKLGEVWQDDDDGRLETKIASIAATIIAAGERKFRLGLREAEERLEQRRVLEEKKREEELAARNRRRLEDLRTSGQLLQQAEEIRALVTRVRQAMMDGSVTYDRATVEAWEQWASAEADRIDPIRSGQVMSHLNEPIV